MLDEKTKAEMIRLKKSISNNLLQAKNLFEDLENEVENLDILGLRSLSTMISQAQHDTTVLLGYVLASQNKL